MAEGSDEGDDRRQQPWALRQPMDASPGEDGRAQRRRAEQAPRELNEWHERDVIPHRTGEGKCQEGIGEEGEESANPKSQISKAKLGSGGARGQGGVGREA